MIYVYDGTWGGMLTLVCRTAQEGAPEDVLRATGEGVLLESTPVLTDAALAGAVEGALRARLGRRALRDAYLALTTEAPGMDLTVWSYLERLWRRGAVAGRDLSDPTVGRVFHAARAAAREYDRWFGITRFQDVGGVYYAAIGPSCDVLTILAGHFARRLPDPWILHDVRRGRAALHQGGRWAIAEKVPARVAAATEEERSFQALWRELYQSAAIQERANPRCQRGFLPKRVWRYLTEQPEATVPPAPSFVI